MGSRRHLQALLEATEQFAVIAAVYEQKSSTSPDDLVVSVGHFFTTGGSFGPEFSAQVKYALKDWKKLARACRKARKHLNKRTP